MSLIHPAALTGLEVLAELLKVFAMASPAGLAVYWFTGK